MTMDWSATMLEAAGVQARPRLIRSTACRCCRCCATPATAFARPLYWRMNHRGQRALRDGDWKYLRVDGNDYLFNIAADERERANRAAREPQRLAAMRDAWEHWNATMPPIPADATVSLGYCGQGHAAAMNAARTGILGRMTALSRWLPFLNWPRPDAALLRNEFSAGLTVALVMVPQSVAYAGLAGMPLVTGLYAALSCRCWWPCCSAARPGCRSVRPP